MKYFLLMAASLWPLLTMASAKVVGNGSDGNIIGFSCRDISNQLLVEINLSKQTITIGGMSENYELEKNGSQLFFKGRPHGSPHNCAFQHEVDLPASSLTSEREVIGQYLLNLIGTSCGGDNRIEVVHCTPVKY